MAEMYRREQVFVSSTYLDLRDERQEVIQTLLEADCFPAGMEMFPASDDDRWTLIKREIDDSDYYIVIIGGRYGSVDPTSGLSYTEMEFDYAVETGKPVMGFLHGAPGEIQANKTEIEEAARKSLNDFRDKVSDRIVRFWTSPQELGGQVAKSLIKIRRSHPAEGWVRASQAATPELMHEFQEAQLRIRELEAELRERATSLSPTVALASGDEPYEIRTRLRYWSSRAVEDGTDRRGASRIKRMDNPATVTWNELFGAIGPSMMIEATTETIDSALRSLAIENYADLPNDYGRQEEFFVFDDSVDEVLLQLKALGLIEESKRRHPPSDLSHYWSLTPEGEAQLIRLRAARPSEGEGQGSDEVVPKAAAKKSPAKRSAKKTAARKKVAKKVAVKA